MKTVIVTGSYGLIGNEVCRFYDKLGFRIVGIDNDMRKYFFGESTKEKNNNNFNNYIHYDVDIRNYDDLIKIFSEYSTDISLIVHTAAQPSHDWAAKEPITDFTVNALGTLNLLECTRLFCNNSTFIFTSTNKVYGDTPNKLPLIELDSRYELHNSHQFFNGINETMSIDQTKHSLFGVSKVSADLMVQEYGRYFGIKTGIFRGGCLTGPSHAGAELHGFLSYLIKCFINKKSYTVFGYNGKQVRDNIHSYDLVSAFHEFYLNPRIGEVYNIGGSRYSNISMLESIDKISNILNTKLKYTISKENRIGDHIWYISDVTKFKTHYPNWNYKYNIDMIINEMIDSELKNER
jgi:CDP-paratose 2-epimerase